MANTQNNNQYQQPNRFYDPFTQFMFGLPTAPPPYQPMQQMPMQQPKQVQSQSQPQQTNQQQNPPSQPPNAMPFLDNNGNLDFDKLMSGANQVFNLINKTGPMLKQISPLLNLFKK
ncbi:hypothetical protein JOD45_000202 [Scopulibacillus daqui]|uniref:YppG-like protein n=1 Tax=Scopulibacillus daqui TaxID=1469162 RepID=A0ABS2PVC7_9BACL|nr:YppG family protein [Scopulibacillus daqui]MBM7644011.1 hypothetical protein [Scopulibacillus daqui]